MAVRHAGDKRGAPVQILLYDSVTWTSAEMLIRQRSGVSSLEIGAVALVRTQDPFFLTIS